MRFAHMKRILRLDRFRLRGLSGVRDEVLLTATAQNLRRLVKLLGRAPPPLQPQAQRKRRVRRRTDVVKSLLPQSGAGPQGAAKRTSDEPIPKTQ